MTNGGGAILAVMLIPTLTCADTREGEITKNPSVVASIILIIFMLNF
jgi:hypothetical protein